MSKLEFKVSAKTARLIGRENISDVDGALVELIKNAYDADASCVYVKFIMPFHSIPQNINITKIQKYFNEENADKVISFYELINDELKLKKILQRRKKKNSKSCFLLKTKSLL